MKFFAEGSAAKVVAAGSAAKVLASSSSHSVCADAAPTARLAQRAAGGEARGGRDS